MFNPEKALTEIKRVFHAPQKEEPKDTRPKTIASPHVEGKMFIGSGEDAHYAYESSESQ